MSRRILVLFAMVLLSCPAAFGQKVYWANSHNAAQPSSDFIQRANADGSNIETLVSSGFNTPFGVALDLEASKIYFTDLTGPDFGKVMRANLDGSGFEVLVSGLGAPAFIELDVANGKMYWASFLNFPASDRIQRANLDGSGLETLVAGLSAPMGLGLDLTNAKMYWTESTDRKIRRANLDGSGIVDIIVDMPFNIPIDVAIDEINGNMYWTDGDQTGNNGKIMRADLNGGNPQVLVSGLDNVGGIALDLNAGKMYWVDSGTEKIQRANLDGTNIEDVVNSGLLNLGGIGLDPRALNPIPAVSTYGFVSLVLLFLVVGSLVYRRRPGWLFEKA